jgi:hypothetical protein
LRSAKPQVTTSTDPVRKGSHSPSPLDLRESEPARRRLAQHLAREVDPDGAGAACLDELAEIAGAAGEVDDELSRSDADRVERAPSPALVEPERHDAIQRVVARRDAVEHLADAQALLFSDRQIP